MMIKNEDFFDKLNELVGMQVKQVRAGESAGSIFSMELNNATSLAENYYLMVKCSWRLDDVSNVRPITGWREDSGLEGVMTYRIKTLEGDSVSKVSISSFYDLEIYFVSGKRLFVFCDLTPYVIADSNWFFGTKQEYYSVSRFLKGSFEKK